ncbi:MAG: type IV pilus twitching motility protein PilT [Deltaproteobacteria bacterium]|nr:MAG: type IV pilus twitching motility protein PilT [Deltaproteobacteria bacterium]
MAAIDALLVALKERSGSDLHLAAGTPPRLRVKGNLDAIESHAALDDASLRALLREIVTAEQWSEYERDGDLDFAYGLPGVARFRANYLVQQNGAGAVFRIIPEQILTVEQLGLPPAITKLADLNKGLVLVTGPTGSGKSTTLAAIVDRINKSHRKHIVTIEDPIEFVHQNQNSVLSHREVGTHTQGFGPALRAAIRQDADVVLVGEMRDRETIALAITAAEMGMLVFGTLHTNSAAKTIDRIIDAFPAKEQNQVRISLSESLAAVVSQLLVPTADGKGRSAVHEILLRTSALPNIIREGKITMLNSLIEGGKAQGMQTMDDTLFGLVKAGKIRGSDAYMKATNKSRFESVSGADEQSSAA